MLSIILFSIIGLAEESNNREVSVESSIDIVVLNGTILSVEFTADVSYFTLPANEMQYSREDIIQANSEERGAIKYALKSDIVSQMKSSFPDCQFEQIYSLPRYESGLFIDKYYVNLTADFFSMNSSISTFQLVNGLLDSGVFVNYSFPWTALEGWNNTYTLLLSDEIGFKRTNGDVDNKKISWEVFNGFGNIEMISGTITLKDLNPTTPPNQNESVTLVFSLNCHPVENPAMSIILKANRLDMNAYSLMSTVFSLPSSLPADSVRLCVQNNLTTFDKIRSFSLDKYEKSAMSSVESSTFNQSFNLSFFWNESTTVNCSPAFVLDFMDESPPVTGLITDPSVEVNFFNITDKAFFGLINAGAESVVNSSNVNFADVFDKSKLSSSCELILPRHVLFDNKQVVSWNHSTEFVGKFDSEKSPTYDTQEVSQYQVINVKSTDLNLLSFFTGKTEVNLGIGFEKTREIFVLSRSSDLSIPDQIVLPFINADAFRVCIEEGVFSTEEINKYINQQETALENMSRRLFPSIKGSAVNDPRVFQDSLEWNENISSMEDKDPVTIRQYMESTAPLKCHFSLFPPQFSFAKQNFTFIGVPREKVTYNMTFPKGVSINILSSSQPIIQKSSSNGNAQLSLTLNASETGKVATVLLSMEPTLLYVIGLFVPCIISVMITLVLFIVVYIIRKKRNVFRQNKNRHNLPEDNESYENEDYYVPPKPPSSR